jgi:hypothetical protein
MRKSEAFSAAATSCGSVSGRCISSPSSSVIVFDIRDILSFFGAVAAAGRFGLDTRILLHWSVNGNKVAAI